MTTDRTDAGALALMQQECELYRRLLELAQQTAPAPLLEDALRLLVDLTGANEAYLELFDDHERGEGPRWAVARGLSAERVREVRGAISRGIIAAAVTAGETIVTADALVDDRFKQHDSVRRGGIRAVLCAPIGMDPPRGVLYLTSGSAEKRFSEVDRARVELTCQHLAPVVDRALQQHRLAESTDPTRRFRSVLRLDGCVGRSPALAAVFSEVEIAARNARNVLILGETGSGKSQIARLIHENSARAGRPFVTVLSTALQDSLIEAELFGHERGAFTGAVGPRKGLIAQAEHGTLFLDEIGDMTPKAQGTLLHFLETKEYIPIGGSPHRCDVRVIAGTNVDLRRAVDEGRFRRDLLYRLDVISFRMPCLDERREDILALAELFRDETCRSEGRPLLPFSPAAARALETAPWPGNVRELEHLVQRGVDHAEREGATQIEPHHLFESPPGRPHESAGHPTLQQATREFQKRFIEEALNQTGGNRTRAAELIDISRAHLYEMINAFGIPPRRT